MHTSGTTPGQPDPRPILFVGDIQGCAEELEALLRVSGYQKGVHRLIPLGDMVNRGPDALGVLRLLEEHGAEPILGNHELALLEILRGAEPPGWALEPHSAYVQLSAAGCWEDTMARVAAWPLWREGPDWIAVHAGLHPRLPPQHTHVDFLTTVRFCDATGVFPQHMYRAQVRPGSAEFPPWFRHYRGPKTVLFGHWAPRGLVWGEHVIGLDTGCVTGRNLSGLWWPERRLVQVPARKAYFIPPLR